MGIEIVTTGNGKFLGASGNVNGYRVTEDSTPIDPSDSFGGFGQIEFTVKEDPAADGSMLLLDDQVQLSDGNKGRTRGSITSVRTSKALTRRAGDLTVTADSRLAILDGVVIAKSFQGTLTNAIKYYLGLAGITTDYTIDPALDSISVVFPGWEGNLFDMLAKQLCPAVGVEQSLTSNNIVYRPWRQRYAETSRHSDESYSVQSQELAESIEIYYYNSTYRYGALAYPEGGFNFDLEVYQVDAGKTIYANVPISASLDTVNQPTVQYYVDDTYTGPNSVYTVIAGDGLPIPPQQWIDGGGSVTVAIGEDQRSIDLTITGASDDSTMYGPYRIALSSGDDSEYSTLRITGTGVFFDKKLLTLPTGVPPSRSIQKVGITIDNPFITTPAQAYTAGVVAAQKYAGAVQNIGITAASINRKTDKGEFIYPLFSDFDTTWAGKTFAQFDATWAGSTFEQFDDYYKTQSSETFQNQAFGNIAGARVPYREAIYRIRTATITPTDVSYTADRDTLFGDFDSIWTGATFSAFDTQFAGKTFSDHAVIPLWRS